MSKKRRLEWSFFLNDRSRVTYNELCRRCRRDCKQSFRAVVIECPKYLSKRSRKGAEKEGKNGTGPETAEIPLEQVLLIKIKKKIMILRSKNERSKAEAL